MVKRLAAFAAAAIVAAVTAWAGLWFMPFIIGLAASLLTLRGQRVVLDAVAGVLAGWAIVLWILALRGYPVGATARAIAAFAALPQYAFVTVAATLLIAFLLAVVGAWLGRALVLTVRR
jgi:hypothetical protein